ncbi:MAG: DUF4190 domain-containing protein [Actinomycetota bacterium]|nr:DUF4190 domain-containing protein [Actinomycetota bacterium]
MPVRFGDSRPPVNSLAIASLACGIGQILCFVPTAIPAIVCGHLARKEIRRTGERGGGMTLAGLILGYLGLVLLAVGLIGAWAIVVAL